MVIRNDNDVMVYVGLKKIFKRFVMYLLCIRMDKSTEEMKFDANISVVVCIEGMESDVLTLIVESNNKYSLYISKIKFTNSLLLLK